MGRTFIDEWCWVRDYRDVGPCIELFAVYDDSLKKNEVFIQYALLVASAIIGETPLLKKFKAQVTWGKWGARLEMRNHSGKSELQLEEMALAICAHPSWHALRLSTHIFSYGS